MPGQEFQVVSPFAQRGKGQGEDVQTEEEVFPELSLLHPEAQITVRHGDEADIHRNGLQPPYPIDLPLLKNPEQLGLEGGVKLAHLVQHQGSLLGELELPRLAVKGPGEGAFLIAEEFRFQQVFGDRGAVDGHERTRGAGTLVVNVAGQKLLAHSALPLDQDRGIGLRRPLGHLHEVLGERVHAQQGGVLDRREVPGVVVADRFLELIGGEGLEDVVGGAELHHVHRVFDGAEGGHQEDDRPGGNRFNPLQKLFPIETAHADVRDHHPVEVPSEKGQRLFG